MIEIGILVPSNNLSNLKLLLDNIDSYTNEKDKLLNQFDKDLRYN